jgi:hypothetical protein
MHSIWRKISIKKSAVQKYQSLQIFSINWIKIETVFCLKILKTQKLEDYNLEWQITRSPKKHFSICSSNFAIQNFVISFENMPPSNYVEHFLRSRLSSLV